MKKTDNNSDATILRQKAEASLKNDLGKSGWTHSETKTRALVHELQVHQIELEMQNAEICQAQKKAECDAEKYTELYDFAPSGYFTLLKDGEIVELNLAGSQMLGKGRSQLIKSRFGFFVSDDTKQLFNIFLEKVFHGNTKESCDITLSTNGNAPKYVHLTGNVSENREQCFVILVDITERKIAEDALRESEKKYRLIAENTSDGIIIFDGENKVRYVSPAYNKQLGYSEMEELTKIPDDIYSIIHPHDRDVIFHNIFEAIKSKKNGLIYSYRVKNISGNYIWREDNATFKYDAAENYTGAYVICRDISERKLAEAALCLSEERFRAIWEESFDGMRLLDSSGTIVMVNDAFCKQIGRTRDELEDKSLDVMYDPIEAEKILASTVEKFRSKTVAPHFERQITLWSNRKVWFELSNSFIKLGTGQNFLLSIFRDITERKHAEIVLQESETHHRELVEGVCRALSICSPKNGADITEQVQEALRRKNE